MKRVTLTLASLLVVFTLLMPAIALATEAEAKAATATATTSSLIVYPEPPPEVSAEEAYASTEWMKSGDALNLVIALLSMCGIAAILVWGIVASRKASAVA